MSFFLIYLFIYLFRAALVAYGNSQARDWIGAIAAGLHHSHSHSNGQIWAASVTNTTAYGNPRSDARNRTCILVDASWLHYCWATTGTPAPSFFSLCLLQTGNLPLGKVSFFFFPIVFYLGSLPATILCPQLGNYFLAALGLDQEKERDEEVIRKLLLVWCCCD